LFDPVTPNRNPRLKKWITIYFGGILLFIILGFLGILFEGPALSRLYHELIYSFSIPDRTGLAGAITPITPIRSTIVSGPLRVDPINHRYFTDGSGRAILLTGSHTWSNFQDNGGSNPPPEFDYQSYLDFLQGNNHNFFRLWTWEQSRWTLETADENYWFYPMTPFQRTGPENALDGLPKFDLTQFNQDYFDRMRERIIQAGNRGIYVSIMLFNGWSVSKYKSPSLNNPWKGHPFNSNNNINDLSGDPNGDYSGEETQELKISAATAIQEAYVRKVIDTVNDLDNVLFEISNESAGSPENIAWQNHFIDFIHNYEAGKAKQHPVGMTVDYPDGNNSDLFSSHADWVSPNGSIDNPPPADGTKVILADTDHLCGICGDEKWVWESFTRGQNPIFMDGYDGSAYGVGGSDFDPNDPRWPSLRKNLGYVLTFSNRMNLEKMTPHGELASSGYCLANPSGVDTEYLVYLPDGGTVNVNLSPVAGSLDYDWFRPATGAMFSGGTVIGGNRQNFTAPFSGDAVLHLYQNSNSPTPTYNPTPSLDHRLYLPSIQ
jgi:Family of unknown function (DUF6298)/Putative collagen-binding domain of a collagenase